MLAALPADLPVCVSADPLELMEDSGLAPMRVPVRRLVTISGLEIAYARIDWWFPGQADKIIGLS